MATIKENSDVRILIEEAKNHGDHSHQEIELDYVLSGSLSVVIAGQKYNMEQGDILLINTGKLHAWRETKQCLLCRFMIDYSSVCRVVGKYRICFWCNSVSNGYHDTDELREVLNQLIKEFHVSGDRESYRLRSLKYKILDILTSEYLLPGNENLSDVEDARVQEILEIVNTGFSDRISLSDIAGRMFMSESYLSRVFKNAVGISFQEYVNRARLEYAVESILYTAKSIAEISEDCGFSNPSAFNKLFKKTYGCSPTEYKKELTISTEQAETADGIQEGAGERLRSWLLQQEKSETGDAEAVEQVLIPSVADRAFSHNTIRAINCGPVYDMIIADMREQLLSIHSELGVRYVRMIGLFDPNLHLRAGWGSPKYHFALVDSVMDFMVDHDLIPVLDLLCWRKKVYADGEELLYSDSKGDWIPFRDAGDWSILLSHTVGHFADRYGVETVSRWMFELDENNDYHDDCVSYGKEEIPYAVLWEAAYDAIKGISPDLQIGGASSVLQTDHRGKTPDFIVRKLLPYHVYSEDADVYAARITDRDFIEKAVKKERRLLGSLGFPDIPLLVSEWSTSLSERNYYNDSCAKASHVLYHLLELEGENCMLCYRHGFDYTSLFVDTENPLMGGNGLISPGGIKKPIYFAFYFMNRIHGDILEKGLNHVVVKSREGSFYILVFHPKNFGHAYYLHRESQTKLEELDQIYEDALPRRLAFTFRGIPDGTYRVKAWSLTDQEGSALYEWTEMGCPGRLRSTELEYLRSVSMPRVRTTEETVTRGALRIDVTLHPHQVILFHITRNT